MIGASFATTRDVAAAAYALVMLAQHLDMLGQQANPCVPARRFALVDTSAPRC